jgi:hypothetical protein
LSNSNLLDVATVDLLGQVQLDKWGNKECESGQAEQEGQVEEAHEDATTGSFLACLLSRFARFLLFLLLLCSGLRCLFASMSHFHFFISKIFFENLSLIFF